jgi:gliding motility-associated-like protein
MFNSKLQARIFPKFASILSFLVVFANTNALAQFVTIWKTDNPGVTANNQIRIPASLTQTGFNYNVQWESTTNVAVNGTLTAQTGATTISFPAAGTYRVSITGSFPAMFFNSGFNDGGDKDKLLEVQQWGNIVWQSFEGAFAGCTNLQITATDAPNLTNVTSLASAFRNCKALNANLNNWNTASITNMNGVFYGASAFNGNISNWNTANVTTMEQMFQGATVFNSNIGAWNTGNVISMGAMFFEATAFNQNIGTWNTSKVTNMNYMFASAKAFNQNINTWNVGLVTDMGYMFYDATSFNQNLNNWNTGNVATMSAMFYLNFGFNGNISNWNTANVVSMDFMFGFAFNFNQNIGSWNVSKVNSMREILRGASSFNQDISAWNIILVNDLTNAFSGSGLSDFNYNKLLINWAALPSLRNNVTLGATDKFYCSAEAARNTLISTYGWTISDGGKFCPPSIISFSPTSGETDREINITGTSLTGTSAVSFGGVPAKSFIVVNDNSISAIVGSGATGDIVVTTPNGTAISSGFTFLSPKLAVYFGEKTNAAQVINGETISLGSVTAQNVKSHLFSMENEGSFALILFNLKVDNPFTVSTVPLTKTDPGTGKPFSIKLNTTIPGTYSSIVRLQTNDPDIPIFEFTVTQTIIQVLPPIIKTGNDNTGTVIVNGQTNAIDLGATNQNQTISQSFTIFNESVVDLTIDDVVIDNPLFTVTNFPDVIPSDEFRVLTFEFSADAVGRYSGNVELIFANGSFEFAVTAEVLAGDIEVFNAVTPNGDGAHDYLKIRNIESFPNNEVLIINRWGREVFKMKNYTNEDPTKRFEGVSNNGDKQNLTDGTYYYIIDIGKENKISGFLLLQR